MCLRSGKIKKQLRNMARLKVSNKVLENAMNKAIHMGLWCGQDSRFIYFTKNTVIYNERNEQRN